MKKPHLFVFQRSEKTDWKDILQDTNIKPHIKTKIIWGDKLLIQGIEEFPDEIATYIALKYIDELIDSTSVIPDLNPVMYVDYFPKKPNPRFVKPPTK